MDNLTPGSLYQLANTAGRAAMDQCTPRPMIVETHQNALNDNSPVIAREVVTGGVCGFAWINIKPARGSFVKFLKDNKLCRSSYSGGVDIWIHEGGQSMELKMAYAGAFAKVLNDHGIDAYSDSRID